MQQQLPAIFLFSRFIPSLPDEILLPARLDGMTEIEIGRRTNRPAMMPVIAGFSVVLVVFHWNDLYWADGRAVSSQPSTAQRIDSGSPHQV